MRSTRWRSARVSHRVHVLVAVLAVATLLSAERFQVVHVQPYFDEKLEAASRMRRAMELLRVYRVRNVAPIDREVDPTDSGLLGRASSSTTTSTGSRCCACASAPSSRRAPRVCRA